MSKKQKVAMLIDGDVPAFSGASGSEVIHKFDNIYVNEADLDMALRNAKSYINDMAKMVKADKVINVLSCPTRHYWRHEVMPTYKGGRKEYRGPLCIEDLKLALSKEYETYRWDNMEGDDVLGILATDPEFLPGYKKIVVSIDKDMKTLPNVWLYNPDKDYQPWLNNPEDAESYFMSQAIGGDPTDGYTGCIGISVDSATAYLSNPWRWERYEHTFKSGPRKAQTEWKWRKVPSDKLTWRDIVSLFVKAGQTEADALANFQVARICRSSDYDKKGRRVIPWKPERLNDHT